MKPFILLKSFLQATLYIFLLLTVSFYSSAQVSVTSAAGSNLGPQNYTTLQLAFDAINSGVHQGVITTSITGNTIETATAQLNASGSGSANYTSITISPSGGVARTITGNIAGALINLNGADNVTIDGLNTSGNSLTISNTSTDALASTLQFISGASNNTVTKCLIEGSTVGSATANSDRGVIFFSTGGNSNNTITNCSLTAAGSNRPRNVVYSYGTSGNENTGNSILSNSIYNFFSQNF